MAQRPDVVRLDTVRLANLVKELNIKLYWLADEIRVDRKTISRWVGGRIKWIKKENLDALAKALECSPEELLFDEEVPSFATPAEHFDAAKAIIAHQLVEEVASTGKFQLAETIIKATLQPTLPLRLLADLYLQLCIANWRQNKMEEGMQYGLKAEEAARKSDSPDIAVQIQLQQAIIYSKLSRYAESIEMIDDALENPIVEYLPTTKASLLYNQSITYLDLGDFEKSETLSREVIAIQHPSPVPKWKLSAYSQRGVTALIMQQRNDEASEALRETERIAVEADYKRGLAYLLILKGVLEARRGNIAIGVSNFEEGYRKIEYGEQGLYEAFGAEVHRRAQNRARMEELITLGLQSDTPVYRALNLEQRALDQRQAGEMGQAAETMQEIDRLLADPLLAKRRQMIADAFSR